MTPICNDQLTRIAAPKFAANWPGKSYRVGDKGEKNGMPYTVKAFGSYIRRRQGVAQFPSLVWLIVKYKGCRRWKWDCLLIGDTTCFKEKIIFGGPHPNPVFTHYWPKDQPQPA